NRARGPRTVTPRCPRAFCRNCARTGKSHRRASGSLPIAKTLVRSMSPSLRRPTCSRHSAPASSSRAGSTPCGTPSPPICSRRAKTSTPCSASSGIGMSPRPCGISTSVRDASSPPARLWIYRSHPPPEPLRRRRPPPRASARRLRGESTSPISSGPTALTIGARIGWLALSIVHSVVTGGALAPDRARWIPARPRFLFPVRALARVFRGRYLAGLQRAFDCGELHCTGGLASLAEPAAFTLWLAALRAQAWLRVPQTALRRAGARAGYTHRVALSNDRLLGLADGRVRFRWRDYADADRVKVMALDVDEFLRRFLLHIVPD